MKSIIVISDRGKLTTYTAVREDGLENGMYYDEEKTLYLPKRLYEAWTSKDLSGRPDARKNFIETLEKL